MDSLSSIFWGTFVLAPLLEDCGPTSASPQAAKNAAAAPAAMTPRLVTGRIDHRRKSSSSVTDSPFAQLGLEALMKLDSTSSGSNLASSTSTRASLTAQPTSTTSPIRQLSATE